MFCSGVLEVAMRYGVLGPIEAHLDGEVVPIGGPQQRRVLALLLSRPGDPVSTDRMVDCLWVDGSAPDGAARSVMTYVSRLRSMLGESSIERIHDGYRLIMDGATTDVHEFEWLLSEAATAEPGRAVELYDRALGLWRGDAYGEFAQEWWLLAEVNRLNELRVVGMEEHAEVMVELGHHQRAIPELRWLRTAHPLRERPVALLMQALFVTGRQADALREFQTYRASLGDETGLEPSVELRALEQSVAAGHPSQRSAGRSRLLRGYTVHGVLGEGAYGRVLAATQPGTNREVAIKVIRPDLANDPLFVQRFEAEAQLVARLEHPHIVPLYDYWREPGGAYLVFRLLAGGTAYGALINGGCFDVGRVSRVVEEVGSALLAAHTAGVVHCDVKPSNVLFDVTGNSYLSDFGIAVASNTDPTGRRTRAYVVPELAGRNGDTVQSDIFSFACMLWELLTGASPQDSAITERWRVPSLAGRVAQRSDAIDAVLGRATARDPAVRYESMAELIVGWRDAVGRPDGVLTPVGESAGSFTSSARRRAASNLTAEISAATNPYKGLRAFAEADAPDFFGRDDVAAALHGMLAAQRFVAVVGPSGSGKSSVVHAGLVPLLRAAGVRIATMVPGDRPTEALRQALRSIATVESDMTDEGTLIEAAVADGPGDLVLVVDQFEECWTLADNADRERFVSALAKVAAHHVACVVTVRADLYDRPLQHQVLGPLVAQGTFALPPLNPEALAEAVVRPARRNGVEFDDGVATAIVAEVSAQPAGLPLLQFALADLYERRSDGRITSDALHELGGIGGAVGRRAESTYQALDAALRPHARELFGRLVTPGLGVPDTRRRARLGELSPSARDVADRFVQARLLVADRDLANREPVVEVAHEALLSNWQRLREWLEADRQWISQLQHLAIASRGWHEAGLADGELYRGSRLEGVLEVLPERGHQLNDDECAFVDASRQARDAVRDRERRVNKRLRRLLTAAVCLVVVALVAGLFAYTQSQRADRSRRGAEITTLANRSLALRSSQLDTAALLAIEANKLRSDSESSSALFATFTRDPGFLGYHTYDGARVEGAVVPNTNTAVVMIASASPIGHDPPLRRVDLATGELGPPFEPIGEHDLGVLVTVSGDGRAAVGYAYDGRDDEGQYQSLQMVAFDVSTGNAIGPRIPISEDPQGYRIALNVDGSQAAVVGGVAGDVQIFDVVTGERLATIAPPPDMEPSFSNGGDTSAAGWAPDGQLYIGSSGTHFREFDPNTFEQVRDITVPMYATGGLLKFSEDGAFMVARGVIQQGDGSLVGSAARVDLVDGTVAWTIPPDEYGSGTCDGLAFSEPEGRLWCGDFDGIIRGRSLSTGALDGTTVEHQRGWLANLDLLAVDGNRYLVTLGRQTASIGRWQVGGNGPLTRQIADGNDYAEYSPDGRWMLVGRPSNAPLGFTLSVWDQHDDREVLALPTDVLDATWVDEVSIGAITDDGHVRVVDVRTGDSHEVTIDLQPDWEAIARVGVRHLALGYPDGHVDVFDVDTGKRVRLQISVPEWGPGAPRVSEIATSEDGTRIYVSGNGVYVFDARDGRQVQRNLDTSIISIDVAGDGPIAVGHFNGTITLLDPADLSVEATLPGTRSGASLRFSADGRLLLATSGERMSLYDIATRQRIGDPIPVGDVNTDLRPDGLEIAVAHHDASGITLWSLDPATLTRAACTVAGRNLTAAEWETYIGDLAPYRATCPNYAFRPR
jgi:DNA-binding SARP family transcriptional activator